VFGHIHEGYGQTKDTSNTTCFINASNCNLEYDPNKLNPPIVFDVPIPAGGVAAAATTTTTAAAASPAVSAAASAAATK